MPQIFITLLDHYKAGLELLFGGEPFGSVKFNIYLFGVIAALLFFGRWVATAIGSGRGTFGINLSFICTIIISFFVYAVCRMFMPEFVDIEYHNKIAIGLAIGAGSLSVIFIAPHFVGTDSIFKNIVGTALCIGIVVFTVSMIHYLSNSFAQGQFNFFNASSITKQDVPDVLSQTKRYYEQMGKMADGSDVVPEIPGTGVSNFLDQFSGKTTPGPTSEMPSKAQTPAPSPASKPSAVTPPANQPATPPAPQRPAVITIEKK